MKFNAAVTASHPQYEAVTGRTEPFQMSVNRLIDKMATLMLAEFDAGTRFQLRAGRGRGKVERGLALLDKAAAAKTDSGKG